MRRSQATKLIRNLILLCALLFCLISFSNCTHNPRSNDMFCHKEDEAILLQIKSHFRAVGGLSDWDPNTDCDTWPFVGVTGEESAHPGRVTAVTISGGSGLSGQIPSVIGNLRYLEEIMFINEPNLTGPIPESFSKLKNLQIIYLSSNGLSGRIPEFLGGLKKIQQIDVSGNRFSGSIPTSLSNLPALTSFNVSRNQLCGPIPKGLKKFGAPMFEHNKCLCGAPLRGC